MIYDSRNSRGSAKKCDIEFKLGAKWSRHLSISLAMPFKFIVWLQSISKYTAATRGEGLANGLTNPNEASQTEKVN